MPRVTVALPYWCTRVSFSSRWPSSEDRFSQYYFHSVPRPRRSPFLQTDAIRRSLPYRG